MKKFYTRVGDDGTTGRLGKGRLPKHHPILEAVGTVDEVTAALGMARAFSKLVATRSVILEVQRDLYRLMSEISVTPENAPKFHYIDSARVEWLESQIDELSKGLRMPDDFIIPGDSLSGAAIDLARTTVRRSERRVSNLVHEGLIQNQDILRYLNRLSSLCFALELVEIQAAGISSPTFASEG